VKANCGELSFLKVLNTVIFWGDTQSKYLVGAEKFGCADRVSYNGWKVMSAYPKSAS